MEGNTEGHRHSVLPLRFCDKKQDDAHEEGNGIERPQHECQADADALEVKHVYLACGQSYMKTTRLPALALARRTSPVTRLTRSCDTFVDSAFRSRGRNICADSGVSLNMRKR